MRLLLKTNHNNRSKEPYHVYYIYDPWGHLATEPHNGLAFAIMNLPFFDTYLYITPMYTCRSLSGMKELALTIMISVTDVGSGRTSSKHRGNTGWRSLMGKLYGRHHNLVSKYFAGQFIFIMCAWADMHCFTMLQVYTHPYDVTEQHRFILRATRMNFPIFFKLLLIITFLRQPFNAPIICYELC